MALPEKVRVRAVEGVFAPVPGYAASHGMQVELVGRRVDHEAIKANSKTRADGVKVLDNLDACYPIDAEHNAVFTRDHSVFSTLRKMIADGDIAAADDETAKWAGVKSSPTPQSPRVPRRTATETKESG